MSFKRLFPESGSYDVTMSVSTLQQRCNELSNVTTTNMADVGTGYKTTNDVQLGKTSPTTTASSFPTPPTSFPSTMMKTTTDTHVDAIVEVAPTANIGFRTLEMDDRSRKADGDIDALSNLSKSSKCENCMVNCLYYSQECCKCTII